MTRKSALPPDSVPLAGKDGRITREWLTGLQALQRRANAETDLGESVGTAPDQAAAQAALGLAPGVDVMPYGGSLETLEGLEPEAGVFIVGDGADWTAQGAEDALVSIGAQPLDATLTAWAGFNSDGLLVQTAADTFVARSLSAPAAGLTITNPAGAAGNPTFALANDLAALEGLGSTGIAVRTGADSWNQRSIAQGAGISVSNGDGIGGNPTVALSTPVSVANGGTGASNASAARASLEVPGHNYLENASFDVWQQNTTFTVGSGNTVFVADRWKARRAATSMTVSRQAGFSGALYCLRFGRDAGDSTLNSPLLAQQIESQLASHLGGKTVTISFDLRKGADYSGGNFAIFVLTGTGIDEPVNLNNGAFATGSSPQSAGSVTPQAAATRHAVSATIPTGTTEAALRLNWLPTGTAGAADYLEITNVKLEVGGSATPFVPAVPADTMEACLRHFEKSFSLGTAPAQNLGANTGEDVRSALTAGANPQRLGTVQFKTRKRGTPAITLYNPGAANADVRDLTAAANCTATVVANVNDREFKVSCTGAAGTAVGNELGFHWVADARL